VAKFHGDRPREFGDPVARRKKTSAVKYKANVPGGLIITRPRLGRGGATDANTF